MQLVLRSDRQRRSWSPSQGPAAGLWNIHCILLSSLDLSIQHFAFFHYHTCLSRRMGTTGLQLSQFQTVLWLGDVTFVCVVSTGSPDHTTHTPVSLPHKPAERILELPIPVHGNHLGCIQMMFPFFRGGGDGEPPLANHL